MEIRNLRPIQGAGGAVAYFDIEIALCLCLTNWQLRYPMADKATEVVGRAAG